MAKNYTKDLNEQQQKAVKFGKGPLLILAGAGSGKTRALTYRTAYLIKEKDVAPENILLVTFTNKAAGEMKERLKKLVGSDDLPFAGTFHSFCARFLRKEGKVLGIPIGFTIFDEKDSVETIKQAMENLGLSDQAYKPRAIKAGISQAKNELMGPLEYEGFSRSAFYETVAKVYFEYQRLLKNYDALDFDDLLMQTVKALKKDKQVLERYRDKYEYVLVDEYQDTNKAQYELTKMLASKWRNLTVVGDASQCLPAKTKILTKNGYKNIEKIKSGDYVLSAIGRGQTGFFSVKRKYKRKYNGLLSVLYVKEKKKIRLTPNHIMFARVNPVENAYHVYLMYRRDKGYRIGIAKGIRAGYSSSNRRPVIGISSRGNQESADKMWILKTCQIKREAVYWEYYFSFKYGIPTLVFDTGGRSMKIAQKDINQLFQSINTNQRAQSLMEDLKIDPRFPHHRPKGISGKKHIDRQIIHLKFFEDRRISQKSPWCAHRISLNTTDRKLEKSVQKAGLYTREGRRKTWRTEIMRLNYKEAEKIAQYLSKSAKGLEISYEAFLSNKEKYFFQPASHIKTKMSVAGLGRKKIVGQSIDKVGEENYKGYVYDLEVEKVHNYIANGFVVHNSVYGWRGADYRNLNNLKRDFKDLTVINLEQNYRSTEKILKAANQVIVKNTGHPVLKLWTDNKEGEQIRVIEFSSEKEEAEYIANLISASGKYDEFAVLYRTNAQSRVVEEAFIRLGVPYVLVGGTKFYERKEVKDLLAYLKYVNNPKDAVSYKRIEKLGKRRLDKFLKWVEKNKNKELVTREILEKILRVTSYLDKFNKKDEQDLSRIENIKELKSVAEEFKNLEEFLENVALVEQTDVLKNEKAVTLMTLHTSKGLEFKNVFMVGMEEGLFPHSRSMLDNEELEEERRLCYVGMTRAKEGLY
ncbi:UvrD-helicase domain-containing protein, partial [Patescibacteria group bacterium]